MAICKLTGKEGKFVKAHLIPKALTYPEHKGEPFTQAVSGRRPVRRWSSWYDQKLVTAVGEEVLGDLDNWGIRFLRDSKLVWSGWGAMLKLPVTNIGPLDWGVRKIEATDPAMLRRFLHSVLWRAAASDMEEFREVTLSKEHLERLRKVVTGEADEGIDFFPATVTQMSTMGIIHNLSPIAQTKTVPAIADNPERLISIFRFYFDGCIVHFHRHADDGGYTKSLGPLIVGAEKELTVSSVTFEKSFQLENLMAIWSELDLS